ncbi:hypothetical protein C8Q79DRAFT_44241 [Trametes meyenii]|nr:hypothetical protein C8Q79DRAFT_44241 [Trametes meyenii]
MHSFGFIIILDSTLDCPRRIKPRALLSDFIPFQALCALTNMTTPRVLPPDIIHEILVRVPDLATLADAVRLSKAFHNVFQDHSKLITHAVLRNVIGFALPQAKRLAQYLLQLADDPRPLKLPAEEAFQSIHGDLSKGNISRMKRDADIVHVLEKYYSVRYKDRKSPTCVLEPSESLKFHRAMYRYWLCFKILEEEGFWWKMDEDSDDEDGDEEEEEERMEKLVHDGFLEFLKGMPTQELLELLEIRAFLEEMRTWVTSARRRSPEFYVPIPVQCPVDPADIGVNLGVTNTTPFMSSYVPWLQEDPIRKAARELLQARKVPDQQLLERNPGIIIGSPHGAEDSCSRCNVTCGNALLGKTNMFLLSGIIGIHEKMRLLPGRLPRTNTETKSLAAHIMNDESPVPDEILVYEMMNMDDADAGEHWSKDGWYCVACLKELFRQRLMLWWREAKQKAGAPVHADCWYGYNCRTMIHREQHAAKLNHLCVPMRGDAPTEHEAGPS